MDMISLLDLVERTRLARGADRRSPTTNRTDAVNASDVDARKLEAELRGAVRGEVRFDDASRGMYSTDPTSQRNTHDTVGGMIGNNSCGIHSQMAGTAQLLKMALSEGPASPAGTRPERYYLTPAPHSGQYGT
jgi:hypothetical protein